MKESIVVFHDDEITWCSDCLYKINPLDRGTYMFSIDFDGYYELIGNFYKTPQHFNFKAEIVLSLLLRLYLDELIWDATTGCINLEASGKYLYTDISYSYFSQSPATTKKVLSILEELSVVKVLEKKSKTIDLKLYLQKINEFLKRGIEKARRMEEHFCEMNNIEFEGVRYIAI